MWEAYLFSGVLVWLMTLSEPKDFNKFITQGIICIYLWPIVMTVNLIMKGK